MKRIVAGPRAVLSALRGKARVAVVYVDRAASKMDGELEREATRRKIPIEARDRGALDAIADGVKHQGVLAVTGEYPYTTPEAILVAANRPALLVALDSITDPHNFGAIVRSAVAFGADGILIPTDRAVPVTPTVVRVSTGATEHARIARVTNLARTLTSLREEGLRITGLTGELGATPLAELPDAPEGRVLVVGSEGKGMRRLVRERCDELCRIPMAGPVEALNASVAAAVALYALTEN